MSTMITSTKMGKFYIKFAQYQQLSEQTKCILVYFGME